MSIQDSCVLVFLTIIFSVVNVLLVQEVGSRECGRIVPGVPLLVRRGAWGEVRHQANVIRDWLKVFGQSETLAELGRN